MTSPCTKWCILVNNKTLLRNKFNISILNYDIDASILQFRETITTNAKIKPMVRDRHPYLALFRWDFRPHWALDSGVSTEIVLESA